MSELFAVGHAGQGGDRLFATTCPRLIWTIPVIDGTSDMQQIGPVRAAL